MESKEYEELLKKIDSMQSKIEEQEKVIRGQDSRLKGIKGDLLSQEHRFLNAWYNFISYFIKKDERDHFKEKLSAVIQGFLPGTKASIVIGGSIVGLLTIVLMYQSNQLMLLQNQYLQKQIYIQADSDRRDQLVNIMEKLYEPSEADAEHIRSMKIHGSNVPVEPKYNSQTRTQSARAYLNIIHNPLEEVREQRLESITDTTLLMLNSFVSKPNEKKSHEYIDKCDSMDMSILSEVKLNYALLSDVDLNRACLKYSNIQKANFAGANLSVANLSVARLVDSDFRGAYLYKINLRTAILTGANISAANLEWSKLEGAYIERANFQGAFMDSAKLINVTSYETNFQNAELINVDFSYSELKSANFKNANLSRAQFHQVDLTNAIFQGADLEETSIEDAKGFTCNQLMSAKNWKLAITDLKCEER